MTEYKGKIYFGFLPDSMYAADDEPTDTFEELIFTIEALASYE